MNPLSEDRRCLAKEFSKHEVETLFIESACDDEKIIEENVRSVKISSPDYIGWSSDDAVKHYLARMSAKIPHFETMEESDLNYIKMINAGERITVNNCSFGYLSHRYVRYFPGYLTFKGYPLRNKLVKRDHSVEWLVPRLPPLHRYSSQEQAKGLASHPSKREIAFGMACSQCISGLMLHECTSWEQAKSYSSHSNGACCWIGFFMPLE